MNNGCKWFRKTLKELNADKIVFKHSYVDSTGKRYWESDGIDIENGGYKHLVTINVNDVTWRNNEHIFVDVMYFEVNCSKYLSKIKIDDIGAKSEYDNLFENLFMQCLLASSHDKDIYGGRKIFGRYIRWWAETHLILPKNSEYQAMMESDLWCE